MNKALNKFPSPDRQREQIDDDENKENNIEQTPEKIEQQQGLGEASEEPAIDHEGVREKDKTAIESAQRDLEDAFGSDPEQQTETDEEIIEKVDKRVGETFEEEIEKINKAAEETVEGFPDKYPESLERDIEAMDPETQEYLEDIKRQQEAEFKGLNAEEIMSGELGPEKQKMTRFKKTMLAITAGAMLWMSSNALPEIAEAKSSTYGTERVVKKEVKRLQGLPVKELKHFKQSLKKQTNRIFKTFLDSLF